MYRNPRRVSLLRHRTNLQHFAMLLRAITDTRMQIVSHSPHRTHSHKLGFSLTHSTSHLSFLLASFLFYCSDMSIPDANDGCAGKCAACVSECCTGTRLYVPPCEDAHARAPARARARNNTDALRNGRRREAPTRLMLQAEVRNPCLFRNCECGSPVRMIATVSQEGRGSLACKIRAGRSYGATHYGTVLYCTFPVPIF